MPILVRNQPAATQIPAYNWVRQFDPPSKIMQKFLSFSIRLLKKSQQADELLETMYAFLGYPGGSRRFQPYPMITRGRFLDSGSARWISSRTIQGTLPSPKSKKPKFAASGLSSDQPK